MRNGHATITGAPKSVRRVRLFQRNRIVNSRQISFSSSLAAIARTLVQGARKTDCMPLSPLHWSYSLLKL
jgi:hypothetical protein